MRSGSQTIHFKRGDILDTNDTVLATSERSYNVILDVAGLLETKTSYQNKKINATVEALVKGFDWMSQISGRFCRTVGQSLCDLEKRCGL